ncbi:MAG TPA: hypothetical protein VLF59_02150 [Candidatus Saccharimonadales bacterium]|nr:hypothetical protein [Candidatus Saccharimonadales bacterium]
MKKLPFFAAAVVAVTTVVTTATAFAGYYPADRQTYTCTTPNNCKGADHVQFNSFTNNPVVGDERPFLAGSINGAAVQDRMQVKDGDVITVRAYVHNNADATLMGSEDKTVAKNVKFRLIVPTAAQNDTNIIGFISADNANPAMVNDTMSVYAASNFTLEYVKGSAEFDHKADGTNQITTKLGDDIVSSTGTSLGDINGCFAYSGYIYVQVKVHMTGGQGGQTPAYSCDLLHVVADNNSRKVTIDKFEAPGTNGATFKNAVIDWGDKSGLLTTGSVIGQMHTYAAAGTYTVTATAHFTVNSGDQSATSQSCAQTVTFTTTATPPAELPDTGAGNVIGIAALAMVAGTIGYRAFLSRKLARR